jgi:hypothetical protein
MALSNLLGIGKSVLNMFYDMSGNNKCQQLLKRVEEYKKKAIEKDIINYDNFSYVVNNVDKEINKFVTSNNQEECDSITNDKINLLISKYAKEYVNFNKIVNSKNTQKSIKSIKSINSRNTQNSTCTNAINKISQFKKLTLKTESNKSNESNESNVYNESNVSNENTESKRIQLTQKQLKNINLGTVKFNNPFPNTANASICVDYFPGYIDKLTTQVIKNINNLEESVDPIINIYINSSDMKNSIPFFYTLVCKLLYNSDHNLTEKTFKSINEINQMSEEGITRKIWEGVQKILYYQSIINNSIISDMLLIPELNENDKEALVTLLEFIKNNKSNLKRSYFYKINEFIMNL